MNTKNLLAVWAKRAIPALALAATAGVMLPSCEKEPIEQHDEVIWFYNINNDNPRLNNDTIRRLAMDKHVRNVYITVANGSDFLSNSANAISSKRRALQESMNISPKVHGRGNFEFVPGVCTRGDSLDLVAMGFTINKQNQR